MAEPELIQKRLLSGTGLLLVPTDVVKNRYVVLYSTVIRKPTNPYLNANYSPRRSRYGTLVFLRQGYVVDSKALEFEKQVFDGVNDISGQTMHAVKCAYAGMLQTIFNLAVAISGTPGGIGLTPTTIDNSIKDYTNLRLMWDECRVVCYGDTAVELQLWRQKYDICDLEQDKDDPPPPPEPPPSPVPPGTPIENISPPYNADTNDDGISIPYPGDASPPPEPEDGSLWEVVYQITLFNSSISTATRQWKYPYNAPTVSGTANNEVYVQNSGAPAQTFISLGYNTLVESFSPGAFPPPGGIISAVVVLSETQIS